MLILVCLLPKLMCYCYNTKLSSTIHLALFPGSTRGSALTTQKKPILLSLKLILVATGTEPLAQAVATQGTDITEKYLKLLSEPLYHSPDHQPSLLKAHKTDVLPWLALKGRNTNVKSWQTKH